MTTIALDVLLGIDKHGADIMYPHDITPWQCPGCPFGKLVERWEDVRNDESEAHYDCDLLSRRVWGEEAPCTIDDWRAQARKEIGREPAAS